MKTGSLSSRSFLTTQQSKSAAAGCRALMKQVQNRRTPSEPTERIAQNGSTSVLEGLSPALTGDMPSSPLLSGYTSRAHPLSHDQQGNRESAAPADGG